ncbi:zinc-binding dehydrogenase [Rhizomonospora bruguierae]|uniref:zinc-binding dehydrogenase n=1 Tax=Rhizomonospora bruguierae TaxID=1581705 RepID=UPI001BD1682F|nr:zinc-binding dehydrogenase [Micromonospora sp. NBRC 107566]
MTATMRAIQLDAPARRDALHLREVPVPEPPPGWARIAVEAFGINRADLEYDAGGPRIPGVECAGVVRAAPETTLRPGQQVVALLGGMGRDFDGSYAEEVMVPASQVVPIGTDLPWEVVAALPQMLQAAHGSLTVGLNAQPGHAVLIRGGTAAVGLCAAALAAERGATVLATTRREDRLTALAARGVEHPILDEGEIAAQVRDQFPEGVDGTVDLVGPATLPDSLRATRAHGTVCVTGSLCGRRTLAEFEPMVAVPNGVRLTGYQGGAADLPAALLQRYLDAVADGRFDLPIHRVYPLEGVMDAHTALATGEPMGKLVVRVRR